MFLGKEDSAGCQRSGLIFRRDEAVSELLKATLLTQENSHLPYDQSYQFITELQ
jgi:hypothetical protein